MLLSRKYNFIFIHIYKNAGSSVTSALEPYTEGKLSIYANKVLRKVNAPWLIRKPELFDFHIKASDLMNELGEEVYKSFFSFAFVRNPWDWQVSLYRYMLKEPGHHQHELVKKFRDFNEYIQWRCDKEVRFQKDFIYTKEDELLVDYIGRYENINADFDEICSRIGISAQLPKINVSNTRPYQQFYTDKTIDLVRQAFKPDIETFGYEYEPH